MGDLSPRGGGGKGHENITDLLSSSLRKKGVVRTNSWAYPRAFHAKKAHSSFPSPFAATWPCPLPCADPNTHLSSIRTDARQEHGAGKERAWDGEQSHWNRPALVGGTQRSRPAGTQRFPASK